MEVYDLLIIGGGPGGYHMAILAGNSGLKTAVIEGDKFGGVCLNKGCIPSKAFLHFSNLANEANSELNAGFIGKKMDVDQEYVVDYKNKKVNFLIKGTEAQIKLSGAKIIKGWAKILKSENDLFQIEVNNEILTTKKLVIATGSKPMIPPFIKGVKELYIKNNVDSPVITSDEILNLTKIPEKLVIIGAGVIGLELGSHFSSIGSNVTLIDVNKKIAGPFDSEASILFQRAWTKRGIKFVLESKVTEVTKTDVVYIDKSGEEIRIPYDKVLIAIGRVSNIDNLGLENLTGLELHRNFIKTNKKLETSIKNLYAIGDVNGVSMLAHTAYREGEVIIENINGQNSEMNYDAIPSALYGRPEISEIGINEDRAKREKLDVTIEKLPLMYSGRFVVEVPKYQGEVLKIIIDNKTGFIIGLSMFGAYASELISLGSIIVGERFNKERIKKLVFAHPTVHELIKDIVNH